MRIIVVGAGYWGPNIIRNLNDLENVTAIGVSDLDDTRVQQVVKRFPKAHIAKPALEAFLEGYDAAIIVTPVGTHYALAKAAIEAGMSVLVEKPLTRTVAEAEELIVLANAKGVQLMTGHVFHYKSEVVKLANLVRSGELGVIKYLDSIRVNLGIFRSDVNVLWDLAPHDLSIFEALMGRMPLRVSCTGASHVLHPQAKQETMVHLMLDYGNECLGHIYVNWFSPVKQRMMVVAGDKKMAVYDDLAPGESLRVFDCGTYDPVQDTPAYPSLRTGDTLIPYIHQTEPLKVELLEFLTSIRERRSPATDGIAGLRVLRILEAAMQSLARNGEMVALSGAEYLI